MVAIQKNTLGVEGSEEWWVYSRQNGWVVLDRSFAPNRCSRLPEMVPFVRCSDWSVYEQAGEGWDSKGVNRYLDRLSFSEAGRGLKGLGALQADFLKRDVCWQ